MIRRYIWVIAAMAGFSLTGAIAQAPPAAESHDSTAQASPLRERLPGANPLWGVPLSSLTATNERPIFSPSRRPPAPPAPPIAAAEAPPPPSPPPPEPCPFTLVGTALGEPQNVAVLLNQTTRSVIRLHVGEMASGWSLRSVDMRTMTLEKDSQVVTLALPPPAQAKAPAPALALAGRISREF